MHSNVLGFVKGINKFADLSPAEFKMRLGYKPSLKKSNKTHVVVLSEVNTPTSVDWRTQGAVTPVKDQGQCGSCWAFSTTGSIEGINKIKSGTLVSLSEQQLVDCSTSLGNQGCDGGLMDYGFTYAETNKLETEADYPYQAVDQTCAVVKGKGVVSVTGYKDVTAKSETQLLAAVAQQPVSVAIEADTDVFQSYTSGIISSTACGTQLDHGVLVVGYGTEGKKDFWILKNSWGSDWGENGFFRIARSATAGPGICGLQLQASYPSQ